MEITKELILELISGVKDEIGVLNRSITLTPEQIRDVDDDVWKHHIEELIEDSVTQKGADSFVEIPVEDVDMLLPYTYMTYMIPVGIKVFEFDNGNWKIEFKVRFVK